MEAWFSPDFAGSKEERAVAMYREALLVEQQPENLNSVAHDTDMVRMFEQRPVSALEAYTNVGGGVDSIFASAINVKISEWNILRSVVLTAWAMLSRSKVRGRFITSRGTGKQKKRAEDATRWLDGWSDESQLHKVAGLALRDAMVCRFGVVQLFEDDEKVKLQRCLPHEISFDYVGSVLGQPKTIHRKRPMSKASLLAKFGKGNPRAREAIKNAKAIDLLGTGSTSDMILVRESYSLPSSKTSKDGYHAIAIEGEDGSLLVEEWSRPWWPFVFFVWDEAFVGLSGISLASQLETIQTELNYMAWVERKAFRLMVAPKIAVKRGSKVVKSQLNNQIGGIIEYTDTPPTALNWGVLPPEFYSERDKRVDKMYSVAGIAPYVSEGTKAPGAESGVAQREALDAQGLRLQTYAQRSWEAPIVEIFTKAVEMASDLAADGGYKVKAPGPKSLDVVDFKGTVSDLKDRAVTIYPTGFLPLTPSARLDFILQMLNSKLWDVDRCRQALSDLDVDSESTLENQIQRMATKTLEDMLYEGKPQRPTELDVANYDVIIKTASVYLALARNEPESTTPKNVSLATRYVQELKDLKAQETQGQQAPPPPAPPQQAPAQPLELPPIDQLPGVTP